MMAQHNLFLLKVQLNPNQSVLFSCSQYLTETWLWISFGSGDAFTSESSTPTCESTCIGSSVTCETETESDDLQRLVCHFCCILCCQ